MWGFLFGVVVGAVGFWAYKFWKGEEDTSWEQPYSSSDTGSSSYSGSMSEPATSGTRSSTGTDTSTTPTS